MTPCRSIQGRGCSTGKTFSGETRHNGWTVVDRSTNVPFPSMHRMMPTSECHLAPLATGRLQSSLVPTPLQDNLCWKPFVLTVRLPVPSQTRGHSRKHPAYQFHYQWWFQKCQGTSPNVHCGESMGPSHGHQKHWQCHCQSWVSPLLPSCLPPSIPNVTPSEALRFLKKSLPLSSWWTSCTLTLQSFAPSSSNPPSYITASVPSCMICRSTVETKVMKQWC